MGYGRLDYSDGEGVRLRDGTFDDFEKLLPLAYEVHSFTPPPVCDLPLNDAQIQRVYVVTLVSEDGFVKIAERDNGEIAGCMVGVIQENQWGLRVAQDLFNLSKGGTRMLLEAFRDWAAEKGADMTHITDLCERPGYGEMIKDVGFKANGKIYTRVD